MGTLLAVGLSGLTIIQWVILAVVLCGVIGILFVVSKQTGVVIPPWVISIFWIVCVVVVAVVAIKLLASLLW